MISCRTSDAAEEAPVRAEQLGAVQPVLPRGGGDAAGERQAAQVHLERQDQRVLRPDRLQLVSVTHIFTHFTSLRHPIT